MSDDLWSTEYHRHIDTCNIQNINHVIVEHWHRLVYQISDTDKWRQINWRMEEGFDGDEQGQKYKHMKRGIHCPWKIKMP